MRRFLLLFFCIAILSVWFSCRKDHVSLPVPIAGCDTTIAYNHRVYKILETYCAQPNAGLCHDAATQAGRLTGPVVVDDYASAVKAFKTQDGLCYTEGTCQPAMPYSLYFAYIPDSTHFVPADTLNIIKCWISNGYKQ